MPRYDLHCHSTCSDGLLTPAEVVKRAARDGVDVLALTDHDETGGLAEACSGRARDCRDRCLSGVRALGELGGPHAPRRRAAASTPRTTRSKRDSRRSATVATRARGASRAALAAAGIAGAYEGARKLVTSERLISRYPFRALPGRGQATRAKRGTCSSAISRQASPATCPHAWATLAEASRLDPRGRRPGGACASGTLQGRRPAACAGCWPSFATAGGDGIEVLSASHTRRRSRSTRRLRARFGLLASSGSDYHGPGESAIDLGELPPLPAASPVWPAGRRERSAMMPARRTVFFVSDRTGITAEMLGNSLLSQFEEIPVPARHDSIRRLAGEGRRGDPPDQRERGARGPAPARVQLDRRRGDERDHPARGERADAGSLPGIHRAARSRARREELARRRPLARHRQQPRVFRADGGDQLHPGARRRRVDARPRQGAGHPGRRVALRQDADVALSRAAVRRSAPRTSR